MTRTKRAAADAMDKRKLHRWIMPDIRSWAQKTRPTSSGEAQRSGEKETFATRGPEAAQRAGRGKEEKTSEKLARLVVSPGAISS
jgi:hypothetical protein